jgi:uncharacterized protein
MEELFSYSDEVLRNFNTIFDRELEDTIDWNLRLVAVKGARGVGKTTLLLKSLKKKYGLSSRKALYVSMDNLYFVDNTLLGFAREFYRTGGEHLFIDEVHKYKNWSQELKNIYDSIPKLKIAFTSSSILDILRGNADLSRRVDIYHLHGLSFREYLEIETKIKFPKYALEEILKDHEKIAAEINSKVRPYEHWTNYLENGYYPFYLDSRDRYLHRLYNVITQTLENDLVACKPVDPAYITKLKRLLYIIATSTPFQPNVASLSQTIEASRATITQFFGYLRDGELVNLLKSDEKSLNLMSKPDKVYLNNTNLAYAIARSAVNVGNRRETFFFSQVGAVHKISTPKTGDFLVDEKYIFEVGGKSKKNYQIKKEKNAFIASDDLDTGFANKIPLVLFGFLY